MKLKWKLDETLLPKIVIRLRNGNVLYNEKRYEKLVDIPGYRRDNDGWGYAITIDGKQTFIYSQGSNIHISYVKHHPEIDALEFRVLTKNTNVKGTHEWKCYGNDEPFLMFRDKTIIGANSKTKLPRRFKDAPDGFTGYIEVYGYSVSSTHEAIGCWLRSVPWRFTSPFLGELKKYIGETYCTTKKTYETNYIWDLKHWVDTNQVDPNSKKITKSEASFQKYLAMPISENSPLVRCAKSSESSSIVFEKLSDDCEVARIFVNARYTYEGYTTKERVRIYIPKNGKDVCIATRVDEVWTRISSLPWCCRNTMCVLNPEYIENSIRIKYFITSNLLAPNQSLEWLINAIRHPEIEQLYKMGYQSYALGCSSDPYPMAHLRNIFGIAKLPKNKKPLLKKLGLTSQQLKAYIRALSDANATVISRWGNLAGLDTIRQIESTDNMAPEKLVWYVSWLGKFRMHSWYEQAFNFPIRNWDKTYQKKFFNNLYRLSLRNANATRLAADTVREYHHLSANSRPEMEWIFDSYSDIVRAHDALVELGRLEAIERNREIAERRAKENEKYEQKMKELDEERKSHEYEDESFVVRLPRSTQEIVSEGLIQHICIANFVSSHATGATNLYFLRQKDKDNLPFYAIEVNNNGKVAQIHGFGNQWLGNNPEAIPTVIRWIRKNNFTCTKEILTSQAKSYSDYNATYCELPVVDGIAYVS